MKLDFVYDAQGRRIQKLVSTNSGSTYYPLSTNRSTYDGWNVIATLNPALAVLQSFLWGLDLSDSPQGAGGVGGLLAICDSSQGTHFAAYDGNGNVAALVNATNGMVSAIYEYGPFEPHPQTVHREYPRPTMTRTNWLNLNGVWECGVADRDKTNAGPFLTSKILVPFPVESALSGVRPRWSEQQRLWYRRKFTLPVGWQVLLHFEAVDPERTSG